VLLRAEHLKRLIKLQHTLIINRTLVWTVISLVIVVVFGVNGPLHIFILLPFHKWDLISLQSRGWSIFRVTCQRGMFADLYFEQKIRIFSTCTIFGARALECLQFFPHNCDSLRRISLSRPFWGESRDVLFTVSQTLWIMDLNGWDVRY